MKNSQVELDKRRPARNGLTFPNLLFDSGIEMRKRKPRSRAEVYCFEKPVDLYSFDEEYLRRLGARDPVTEAHFIAYFSERLRLTLRARGVDSHTIEDIRQETFCRVWVAVQSGNIHNPQGFGAYVYSVCKNVLSECLRDDHRYDHDSLEGTDMADGQLSLEDLIQRKENAKIVREVLSMLPERDRNVLHARFFEERDNDAVCMEFGVDRGYLRVLLFRAIHRFSEIYKKKAN